MSVCYRAGLHLCILRLTTATRTSPNYLLTKAQMSTIKPEYVLIVLLSHRPRAGFSWWEALGPWWEAWAQWRIWDFRKGLAIELHSFKN